MVCNGQKNKIDYLTYLKTQKTESNTLFKKASNRIQKLFEQTKTLTQEQEILDLQKQIATLMKQMNDASHKETIVDLLIEQANNPIQEN